jgi:hypothetical protein
MRSSERRRTEAPLEPEAARREGRSGPTPPAIQVEEVAAASAAVLVDPEVPRWSGRDVLVLADHLARHLAGGESGASAPRWDTAFTDALAEAVCGDAGDVPPALIEQLVELNARCGTQFVEQLLDAIDRLVYAGGSLSLHAAASTVLTVERPEEAGPTATGRATSPMRPRGAEEAAPEPCQTLDRFSWLFARHVVPPACRVTSDEFEAASRVARSAPQAIALTGPRLLRWAGPELATGPVAQRIRDKVVAARALVALQSEQLRELHTVLTAAGIPYVILKGAAVRELAYPDPLVRSAADIDIGVAPDATRTAEAVAVAAGFHLAEWDPEAKAYRRANLLRRRLAEHHHYELGLMVRPVVVSGFDPESDTVLRRVARTKTGPWHLLGDDRLACYVILDIHHGITGRITTAPILETRVEHRGLPVPSVPWCLFHAVSKIYWEGIKTYRHGLHQYADLLGLLDVGTEADVEAFLALVEAHELTVGAYYVLRRLESAFHWPIGPVLEKFVSAHAVADEGRSPVQVNDYGDMWPKLWGYR